jgi:hypothetical protein
MAEYDFIAGPRKGKVWKEKYYLRNKKNFIQEAKKYIPINSQWLTKEEFKNYILSLLDKGIPQIYVLEELPEELFPYALIFVQNEGKTSIYVDKEGIRTEINIGDGNYDAVNVVENLPQDLQNNVIYYSENQIDEQKLLEKGLNLDEQKSYIYVYEDEEIKQVIPNVDYIAEEQMVFTNKTINGEDNTIQNLIPEDSVKPGYIINKIEASKQYYGYISIDESKEIVFLDTDGDYITSYVYKANLENNIITEITSISDEKVYYDGDIFTYEGKDYERYSDVDQVFPILDKSVSYSQAIKTYVDDKTQPITDITTKSLKNIYNTTLTTDKLVSTDNNGCLAASDISKTDAKDVIDGVKNNCLKNIYNKILTADRLLSTGINGTVYATAIKNDTAADVINGVSTKCLRGIYNQTLGAWKLLATDGDGKVVVANKYSVNGTLKMDGTTFGMLNILSNSKPLNFYKTAFDVYGRCTATETFSLPHLYLHKIHYDRGGSGEINFVIYNTQSTAMSLTDIYNFLVSIDCATSYKYYPVSGNIANGLVVSGIFASIYSAGSLSQREFSVVFYEGSTAYTERWIYFSAGDSDKVIQIF